MTEGTKFKPGDEVQCVDADEASSRVLKRGQTYTISEMTGSASVRLTTVDGSWLSERFRYLNGIERATKRLKK